MLLLLAFISKKSLVHVLAKPDESEMSNDLTLLCVDHFNLQYSHPARHGFTDLLHWWYLIKIAPVLFSAVKRSLQLNEAATVATDFESG